MQILHHALRFERYTCFLRADARPDRMYMPDAIQAMVEMLEADPARLVHRNAFNVTAMSFGPEELSVEIRRHLPDFTIDYETGPVRQTGEARSTPVSCVLAGLGREPGTVIPTGWRGRDLPPSGRRIGPMGAG